jgi:hypothetical protein
MLLFPNDPPYDLRLEVFPKELLFSSISPIEYSFHVAFLEFGIKLKVFCFIPKD